MVSFENEDSFYPGGSAKRNKTKSKSPLRKKIIKPELINFHEPKGSLFAVGGLFQKMQVIREQENSKFYEKHLGLQ